MTSLIEGSAVGSVPRHYEDQLRVNTNRHFLIKIRSCLLTCQEKAAAGVEETKGGGGERPQNRRKQGGGGALNRGGIKKDKKKLGGGRGGYWGPAHE